MDSVFAIKGKDFILVGQECTVAYSIFKLKVSLISSECLSRKSLIIYLAR